MIIKDYKEFYVPNNKPGIVTVPSMNYITVHGEGNPNKEDIDYSHKEIFKWISVIRLPDFVTKTNFEWVIEEATKKEEKQFFQNGVSACNEGLCVQCMHTDSYDEEPVTAALMHEYMMSQGYILDINDKRLHHEIYLSDA